MLATGITIIIIADCIFAAGLCKGDRLTQPLNETVGRRLTLVSNKQLAHHPISEVKASWKSSSHQPYTRCKEERWSICRRIWIMWSFLVDEFWNSTGIANENFRKISLGIRPGDHLSSRGTVFLKAWHLAMVQRYNSLIGQNAIGHMLECQHTSLLVDNAGFKNFDPTLTTNAGNTYPILVQPIVAFRCPGPNLCDQEDLVRTIWFEGSFWSGIRPNDWQYKLPACYLRFFTIFWLQTTLRVTMQFSKLIFSFFALAAVSANPLSAKIAPRDCDYDCGKLCYEIYGSYANTCDGSYELFIA